MGRFDAIKNIFNFNMGSYSTANRGNQQEENAKKIGRYISPVQFVRYKQDIGTWRESISEAEQAWYPFRVKMQRIYMDTVLNGHVIACIRKRKNLVLLKDFGFYSGETVDQKFTDSMKVEWFYNLINYALEAEYYGYSLIELGDMINNEFNQLTIVRRENISPDRLNLATLIYSISGLDFTDPSIKDESGASYADWSIYIDTPSNKGTSKCGYGLLYEVAPYEILLRNLQGYNSDYAEVFGQPLKHAKSNKLEGAEYDNLEASLANMSSNSYLITDHETELNFVSPKGGSNGSDVYSSFEERLEKKITKIFFGHGSAMDAVPGKLGSNDDIKQALREIETVDCRRMEHIINKQVIPKLINIGFPIPKGLVFKYKNDKEKEEIRAAQDASNKITAEIAQILTSAGLSMDAKYFTDRTGIPVEEIEAPLPSEPMITNAVKNSLKELYGDA